MNLIGDEKKIVQSLPQCHQISTPDNLDWDVIKFFHQILTTFLQSKRKKNDYLSYLTGLDIICLQAHTRTVDSTVARYVYKNGVEPIMNDPKIEKFGIAIPANFPYLVQVIVMLEEIEKDEEMEQKRNDYLL